MSGLYRYDIETLEKIAGGGLFRPDFQNKIAVAKSHKAICVRCCSEELYDEDANEIPCQECGGNLDEPTVIHASGDFYNEQSLVLKTAGAINIESPVNEAWTNLVRYAWEKGIFGDKKDEYEKVLENDDINSLISLYKQGNAIATAKLAECYAFGIDVPNDARLAYELFFLAQKRGESYAGIVRAMFLKRNNMPQYSFTVLGEVACENNPVAMFLVAKQVKERKLENYEKISFEWWKKSAEMGLTLSMFKCAENAPTFEESEKDYIELIEKGYKAAEIGLYELYYKRFLDTKDVKAFDYMVEKNFPCFLERWERKMEKQGEQYFKDPLLLFGAFERWLYQNKEEIIDAMIKDSTISIKLPTNKQFCAMIKENLEELLGLERVFQKEDEVTIDLNSKKDFIYSQGDDGIDYESMPKSELLNRAKQGDEWAQYLVGTDYLNETGDKSIFEAKRWLLSAGVHGESAAYDDLFYIYTQQAAKRKGSLIKKYNSIAIAIAFMAAGDNYANASYEVAWQLFYHEDGHMEEHDKVAVAYALKAAMVTHAEAYNLLGVCFKRRRGVDLRDYPRAVTLYKKAAENEEVYGMYNLANCYEKGEGVPKDYNQAAKWFFRAYKCGHKGALERYDKLYRENKVNTQTIENATSIKVDKGDVAGFMERVMEHLEKGYYEDAAANIRHIEETILSFFVQTLIPEYVFDNKGAQRRKLEEAQALPKHYIEILYNVSKIGNSGAHANGMSGSSLTEQDIRKILPALKDLISFYEAY